MEHASSDNEGSLRSDMDRVTSRDGTSIAYDRQGGGPAVILVGGALDDGAENAPLARELARDFAVYNYARRGRGHSGDTPPYAVEREVEDIQALIAQAGGTAHLYGVSSGGALALQATAAGTGVDRVAVYEVPLGWPTPADADEFRALLAEGRRGAALELFMRTAGSSEQDIAGARSSPMWPGLEALAHTLAYDAACMGNGHPPTERFATITRPTLVLRGGAGPGPHQPDLAPDFFEQAAATLAATIPGARRQVIEGQGHMADPKAVAPVLRRFFSAG
jgi:pimeloyl-ACP methyl ester carboxylesterase